MQCKTLSAQNMKMPPFIIFNLILNSDRQNVPSPFAFYSPFTPSQLNKGLLQLNEENFLN
jgi:hypothetical protein